MADISVITLPNGAPYNIKDATARNSIAALTTAHAADINNLTTNFNTAISGLRDTYTQDINSLVNTHNQDINNLRNNTVPLNSSGKIDSSYLPGYVDDIIEGYYYNNHFYEDAAHTRYVKLSDGMTSADQLSGYLYLDKDNNDIYRWTGSTYVNISSDANTLYDLSALDANTIRLRSSDGTNDDVSLSISRASAITNIGFSTDTVVEDIISGEPIKGFNTSVTATQAVIGGISGNASSLTYTPATINGSKITAWSAGDTPIKTVNTTTSIKTVSAVSTGTVTYVSNNTTITVVTGASGTTAAITDLNTKTAVSSVTTTPQTVITSITPNNPYVSNGILILGDLSYDSTSINKVTSVNTASYVDSAKTTTTAVTGLNTTTGVSKITTSNMTVVTAVTTTNPTIATGGTAGNASSLTYTAATIDGSKITKWAAGDAPIKQLIYGDLEELQTPLIDYNLTTLNNINTTTTASVISNVAFAEN